MPEPVRLWDAFNAIRMGITELYDTHVRSKTSSSRPAGVSRVWRLGIESPTMTSRR